MKKNIRYSVPDLQAGIMIDDSTLFGIPVATA